MTNFKKTYKSLYKAYKKRLKKLHKQTFDQQLPPIDYLVTYLQFLRDKMFLETKYTKELGEDHIELISLITALDEFNNYNNCIYKYYDIKNGVAIRKAEFTETTAQENFQKEKTYHWEAFWNLVKLCIDGWCANAES
jgi:hypothetical protein